MTSGGRVRAGALRGTWPRPAVALVVLFVASTGVASASERHEPGASVRAATIARDTQPRWRIGRLELRAHEHRATRVEAEVLLEATVITRLRLDPVTGRFLARHGSAGVPAGTPDLERLRTAAAGQLARLDVGDWAWPMEHGRAWGVPLRYEGRVVGQLAVDVRESRVLPAPDDD